MKVSGDTGMVKMPKFIQKLHILAREVRRRQPWI